MRDMKRRYLKPHVFVRKNGHIVASSNNLGVITRYNRQKAGISNISVRGHAVRVKFDDGASALTSFADPTVAQQWAMMKQSRLGVPVKINRQKIMPLKAPVSGLPSNVKDLGWAFKLPSE